MDNTVLEEQLGKLFTVLSKLESSISTQTRVVGDFTQYVKSGEIQSAFVRKLTEFFINRDGDNAPVGGDSKPNEPREVVKKANDVNITSFSPSVVKLLTDLLKQKEKKATDKQIEEQRPSWWKKLLMLLPLLAGLLALIAGFDVEGWAKDILKDIGRVAVETIVSKLKGIGKTLGSIVSTITNFIDSLANRFNRFTKALVEAAKKFLPNLTELVTKISTKITGSITKFFTKAGNFLLDTLKLIPGVKNLIPAIPTGIFKKIGETIITKWVKVIKPILKRIPIIGMLISFAFAYSRFKTGDYIGCVLEILSGLAGLLDLVLPGLGLTVGLLIDGLSIYMDFQADKAAEGADPLDAQAIKQRAKAGILKKIGMWVIDKLEYLPVIGGLIKVARAIKRRDWGQALASLMWIVPGAPTALEILNVTPESAGDAVNKTVGSAVKWIGDITKWVCDKLEWVPVIGPLIRAAKHAWNGDWKNFFVSLGHAVPGLNLLLSLFDINEKGEPNTLGTSFDAIKDLIEYVATWVRDLIKSIFTYLKDGISAKLKSGWSSFKSWVGLGDESTSADTAVKAKELINEIPNRNYPLGKMYNNSIPKTGMELNQPIGKLHAESAAYHKDSIKKADEAHKLMNHTNDLLEQLVDKIDKRVSPTIISNTTNNRIDVDRGSPASGFRSNSYPRP